MLYYCQLTYSLPPALKGRRGHTREENLMDHRNLTLLTDLYELTMMQGYFKEKDANETVIFDMFYRNNPHGNGFATIRQRQRKRLARRIIHHALHLLRLPLLFPSHPGIRLL